MVVEAISEEEEILRKVLQSALWVGAFPFSYWVELGFVMHEAEGDLLCKSTNEMVIATARG